VTAVDWNAVAAAAANRPSQLRRREHVYDSAAGEPRHRTVRIDYSDGSKQIWQQRYVDGDWQNGLGQDFKTSSTGSRAYSKRRRPAGWCCWSRARR
jgi:hypothetical protein